MGEKYRIKGRRTKHWQQAEGDKREGNKKTDTASTVCMETARIPGTHIRQHRACACQCVPAIRKSFLCMSVLSEKTYSAERGG